MKPDTLLTNPGAGASANPEFLAAVRDDAIENPEPIDKAEALLEHRRFELVMRMTARGFGRLSDVEKRNYARWAKHLARVFAEKASMFERNSKPEPETPAYLQARG